MDQNTLREVTVSEENSLIVDGELKKFNYCSSNVGYNSGLRVIIPKGITHIDSYAFGGRSDVESVYIGKDVKAIYCTAFSGCDNLCELEVSPENQELHSAGNCIIRTNKKRLVIGCQTSKIPTDGSVTQIWSAFYECLKLEKIVIPEGITHLGAEAFHGCERLKEVYLPKSLKFIGKDAFYGCVETNASEGLESPVEIYYSGTSEEWLLIEGSESVFASQIHCKDKIIKF